MKNIFKKQKIHHFYHIYADGNWQDPISEHMLALKKYKLINSLTTINFGIIGTDKNRDLVKNFLFNNLKSFNIIVEKETGYEQETLNELYKFSKNNSGYVLYAHTKGATNLDDFCKFWRRSMTFFTVIKWKECLSLLNKNFSAVGSHYCFIEYDNENNFTFGIEKNINIKESYGFFLGNFWWTDLKYLRDLKKIEPYDRFEAEFWISEIKKTACEYDFKIYDFNPEIPEDSKIKIDSWWIKY